MGDIAFSGSLLILATALAAVESVSSDAVEPSGPIKADSAITIDGNLDKPIWKKAVIVHADYIKTQPGVLSEIPRMEVRYAWDEHYLYIGYEIFDKDLCAIAKLDTHGKPLQKGPENNRREVCDIWSADKNQHVDVVEFFISFGDERFFWEIHHNSLNQFDDIWCTAVDPSWPIGKSRLARWGIIFNTQEYIQDDGEFTVKTAARLKPKADGTPSTVNDSSDVDTGYTAEIRLPWGGIGAPVECEPKGKVVGWTMEGQKVSILAVVQDGGLGDKLRYHHSCPNLKDDWFHKTAASWPQYVLLNVPIPNEKRK